MQDCKNGAQFTKLTLRKRPEENLGLFLFFDFAKFTHCIMEGKYRVRLLFNFCLTMKGEKYEV